MSKIDLMVLAPHEDDELAIAGPMIYQAAKSGMSIKIVFSTNGDYFIHEGPIRIREAIKALQILGVNKEDVIFLGYGDQTQGKHIYNSTFEDVVCAHNGNDTTYSTPEIGTFAKIEYGEEHKYTRNNYKNDIKNVVKKFMPQVIITTDWDNHMDHLALSLMLDEVLGEIFKQEKEYYPLVLKAQAYTGKWEGHADYYNYPNITEHVNLACGVEKVHPLNKWEDRVRFLVPRECRTNMLCHNVLYKAARQYKSQNVDLKAMQFINQDLVFWRRHTESMSYRAKIKASSGYAEFLNDFKCVDCSDIVNDFWNYDRSIWIPNIDDDEKKIEIELEIKSAIKEIHFYESSALDGSIENIRIQFDNGVMIDTGELKHDGSVTRVLLPEMESVKKLSIVIDKWHGNLIGLTEIEIYNQVFELTEYPLPLDIWKDGLIEERETTLRSKLEEKYFEFVKYARGRLWPDKYFLMKRYDVLQEKDSAVKYWMMYFKFVKEKIQDKLFR